MINRRWFLKSCGMYGSVLLSSLPGFTASNISQTTRRKPNIIIIKLMTRAMAISPAME